MEWQMRDLAVICVHKWPHLAAGIQSDCISVSIVGLFKPREAEIKFERTWSIEGA